MSAYWLLFAFILGLVIGMVVVLWRTAFDYEKGFVDGYDAFVAKNPHLAERRESAMTEWTKHTGTSKPEGLADAQIVEVVWANTGVQSVFCPSDWDGIKYYRPALGPDGLPYVSAAGLDPNTKYVCVDEETGEVLESRGRPEWSETIHGGWIGGFSLPGPETHRIPGDPEHSLARVWRE